MAKILCIEDETDIRQLVVEELADEGYETIEAGDGQSGLEAITKGKPDLVLCDIGIPIMSGHDLLKELRASHPEQADLPFIFLTALADREHVLAGKKMGADDYLTKPIDFELLFATIASRLGQVERVKTRKEEQLVKVYLAAKNNTSADGGPAAAEDLQDSDDVGAGVIAQIQHLAGKSGGAIIAGCVQVIGLEDVKESLGPRWPALAKRVYEIAELTIRRRLSEKDVLERTGDAEFLICFGSCNEAEAPFRARAIGQEIREKLLGTDELDIEFKSNCSVVSDAKKVEVSDEDLAQGTMVADLIVGRVKQAAETAKQAVRMTMERIVKSCRIAQIPVMARGKSAPIALAEFDDSARTGLEALRRSRADSVELAAEVDMLRLGRTAELMCKMALDSRPLMIVNVEFSTLSQRRLSDPYVDVCKSLAELSTTLLAFNIRNIPTDLLPSKVVLCANVVRPFCRLITAEIAGLSLDNIDPVSMRAPMVTCSYEKVGKRLRSKPALLKEIAKQVHERKSRLLVYDLPQDENAERLFGLGADFVARRR